VFLFPEGTCIRDSTFIKTGTLKKKATFFIIHFQSISMDKLDGIIMAAFYGLPFD